MSTSTLDNYIADLGALLKDEALDAKVKASAQTKQLDRQFALGRLTAYYEVISLMKQQAEAFGLSDSQLSLQGFDPERELLAVGADERPAGSTDDES